MTTTNSSLFAWEIKPPRTHKSSEGAHHSKVKRTLIGRRNARTQSVGRCVGSDSVEKGRIWLMLGEYLIQGFMVWQFFK